MKKVLSTFALFAMVLATLSLAVHAKEGKTSTWTGWISDSACAAKGTNADHKACAEKCVKEKGASWVFVNSKSKAVLNIHNQDAVNAENDLGHEVNVTGNVMDDGSLHVDKIAAAGGGM
jgi:hypothetical protein